jgi:DNA ligase D-like protein (predicted 3'-phosphoesterase)
VERGLIAITACQHRGRKEADVKLTIDEYRRRRDFSRTPEPQGSDHSLPRGGEPAFVIQKHDEKLPHFDFRMEADGVLVSWVIPEGVPHEGGRERLALRMENYPLEYLAFEGEIPGDQYGGGNIEIWDRGTFLNRTTDHGEDLSVVEGLEQGFVEFELRGEKLKGRYRLERTEGGPESRWLMLRL